MTRPVTDHAALRTLAEAANDRPAIDTRTKYASPDPEWRAWSKSLLTFKAACSPDAILALLDRIEALEGALEHCVQEATAVRAALATGQEP